MTERGRIAAEHRDARNAKPIEEPSPKGGKRKDKRRWCRGKVGVEHEPKCLTMAEAKRGSFYDRMEDDGSRLLVCTRCGKELAWHIVFPPRWGLQRLAKPAPAWVTR